MVAIDPRYWRETWANGIEPLNYGRTNVTLDQTMTKFDQLNVRIEEMGRLIQTQAAEIDHLQKELALAEIRIEELAGEKEERDG